MSFTEIDPSQQLSDKEKQITEAENNLGVVENAKGAIDKQVTDLKIAVDELRLQIKIKERESAELDAPIKEARRNLSRFKREHGQLFRAYMKERDLAKGMR